MARVKFEVVFKQLNKGSLEPQHKTKIGSIIVGPGVVFGKGVAFGGVDFTQFVGNDLEIDFEGDTVVLKGIYSKENASK